MTSAAFFPQATLRGACLKFVRQFRRPPCWLLVAFSAVALLACTDSLGPEEFRTVGYIPPSYFDAGSEHAPQIPETAIAGTPFEITIWTYSFCSVASLEISEYGGSAVVIPYVVPRRGVCTLVSRPHEHTATVAFTDPGTAEIVVRYSRVEEGSPEPNGTRLYQVRVSPAE